MEAYIPLCCLMVVTALLWRRALAGAPIVWTRGRVVATAAAVLCTLAVPLVVMVIILG